MCPPTAAKTELQDIRCQIGITQPSDTRRVKKRKRDNLNDTGDEARYQSPSEPLLTASLDSQDRSAVQNSVTGLTRGTEHTPAKNFENILQAAITVLITGLARHFPGVSVRQGSQGPALVKIVPAVFNVPYVKVCA